MITFTPTNDTYAVAYYAEKDGNLYVIPDVLVENDLPTAKTRASEDVKKVFPEDRGYWNHAFAVRGVKIDLEYAG